MTPMTTTTWPPAITLYGPDQDQLLAWLETVETRGRPDAEALLDQLRTFLTATQGEAFVHLVATDYPVMGRAE